MAPATTESPTTVCNKARARLPTGVPRLGRGTQTLISHESLSMASQEALESQQTSRVHKMAPLTPPQTAVIKKAEARREVRIASRREAFNMLKARQDGTSDLSNRTAW